MKLEEFIEEEKKSLQIFEAWWRAENKKNPKHFPLEMETGDWDEQYFTFER
jgi:hypothetical protein